VEEVMLAFGMFIAGLVAGAFLITLMSGPEITVRYPVLVQLKDARFCVNCEGVYWNHGDPQCPGCGRFRETASLVTWLKSINGNDPSTWKWMQGNAK
jgi:hypothetical protein